MRKIFTVTIVFALAIAFSSCATRKVSRVNTNEVIDLSGRWNDTDSQLVSAEMIDDLLGVAGCRFMRASTTINVR